MKAIIVMSSTDNVGNAIEDVCKEDGVVYTLDEQEYSFKAVDDVPFGFKIAVKDIPDGHPIIKYGENIGVSSRDIATGECVHIHNVAGKRGRGDLEGAE